MKLTNKVLSMLVHELKSIVGLCNNLRKIIRKKDVKLDRERLADMFGTLRDKCKSLLDMFYEEIGK